MIGRDVVVGALRKYQAGIISLAFWFYNAWNAFRVSRFPGYYPKYIMEHPEVYAAGRPYPWESILGTWLLFAVATGGIYYMLRKPSKKAAWLFLYSIVIFVLMEAPIPTDVGGVSIAIAVFPIYTFYLAALVGAWGAISSLRARWGSTRA